MALTYVQRTQVANALLFQQRIEAAVIKYAVYLRNAATGGTRGQWAKDVLDDANYRASQVQYLKWYVLENVASALAVTGSDATLDSTATDAAIQGQVETQVNAVTGV